MPLIHLLKRLGVLLTSWCLLCSGASAADNGRILMVTEATFPPYEFREETQDLTSYDSGNPGAEGYQFHVYESEGGKKTGDYYVDKDTGKVYRYTKDNKIMEY